MKRAYIFAMILGSWTTGPALAQEAASGSEGAGSVSGIFEGVDVGGSPRKHPEHKNTSLPSGYKKPRSRSRDSFAVNPQTVNAQPESPRKNRIQTRPDMIPDVNSGVSEKQIPEPAVAASQQSVPPASDSDVANVIARTTQNTVQGAGGQASPQYYKQLIGAARGQSNAAAQEAERSRSKYTISDKDKF